jgi:hypothetical protein
VAVAYTSLSNRQQSQIQRKPSARKSSSTIRIEARIEINNQPENLSSEKNLLVGWAIEYRFSLR